MTLADYLKLEGLTHEQFAEKAAIKRPTITRLVKPGARPSWKHMQMISAATGGKVGMADWASALQGAA